MRKLYKGLAAAAAAAAIGGVSLGALAQGPGPGWGPMGGGHGMMGGPGFMGGSGHMYGPGGPAAFDPSVRLDALKSELGIRPEQAAVWDAYVKAVKDSAAQMRSVRDSAEFAALPGMSWQEHQAFMAKQWDKRAETYKTAEAAATKLVAAMDDAQKTKALMPTLLPGHRMAAWGGGPRMMGPPGEAR